MMNTLKMTHHVFFDLPIVHQKSLGQMRLKSPKNALHTIPLKPGISLDFYANLQKSDELWIGLHGANSPSKNIYPRFERVTSFHKYTDSFICFADPTMQLDLSKEMYSAWYLGGPSFDPLDSLLRVIRRAQGLTGAKHVAFVGGSAGGYAALRLSAAIPGSLAFVMNPQTILKNHHSRNISRYFRNVWPGWNQELLLEAFPNRFNMTEHYRSSMPRNYIHYAQNDGDIFHIENHFNPFKKVYGMNEAEHGVTVHGNRNFALYHGIKRGHAGIHPTDFRRHLKEAQRGWRKFRVDNNL